MLPANGSLSSQFRRTVSFWQWKWFHSFRKRLSSPLSSSFHPCSAYPLSSNLVLFCRWRTGAIIGSLRLTLDQNVRQFKAACKSAFCTNSSPELPRLFTAYIANWAAQRQRQEKVPHLFMDYTATPAPFQGSMWEHSIWMYTVSKRTTFTEMKGG